MVKADVNTKTVGENHCKTGEDLKLQALRESEERYRTLFETMVLGVVYQDIDGKIISANPAAEQILGLSIDQMQGRTSTDPLWKSIHEDGSDFPGEIHPAMVALKTGKIIKNVVMGVFDPKNEQTRWIDINATPQFKKDDKKPFQVYTTFEDITKRKKAEETLNESEEKFSKAFHSNSAAMTVTRLSDGMIINANESFETLFGYTHEETVGHSTNELGIWLSPQERDAEVEELLKRGKLPMHEVTFGTKSGKHINVLFSVELININGQSYILTTSMDITERKKAEENNQKLLESEQQLTEELTTSNEELQSTTEELQVTNEELRQQEYKLLQAYNDLKTSEERFKSIIENIQDAYMRADKEGTIIMASPSAARMYRFNSTQEMLGTTTHSYFKNSEDRNSAIKNLKKHGKYNDYEVEGRRNDGTFFWVSQNAQYFYDDHGNIQGSETIVRDMTLRKEIEAALKKSERSLDKAQHIAHIGSWEWNIKTDNIIWSNELYSIYGVDQNSFTPTLSSFEDFIHPDDEEYVNQHVDQLVSEGKSHNFDFRIVLDDGSIRVLNTLAEVVEFDKHGEPSVIIGINQDITERKEIELKLNDNIKKLAQSNKELEQFAYITSHDLREPLRMITSFLQLLERRYTDQLDQDANEFIGFAVDGAKRLDAMTKDLLQYSKITSKQQEIKPVNFEHVLQEALINLKIPIEENNAVITHDPLPTINGDEHLKVQLFQNIIGNAIKYRSNETPAIHISAIKENNQYLFCIKDNGIGMSPEHLKRIFTIFQRLHTHTEYEGTGIGLAIAQKIIHQQNGQIWAESEPEKGTTFYFTIPIKNLILQK
jgi:PAS domain S-box-containing protein